MATRADLENSLKSIGWFIDEETMEITNDLGHGTEFFVSDDYTTITRRESATYIPKVVGVKTQFPIEEIIIEVNEDQDQVYFNFTTGEKTLPFLILNQISEE